PVHFLRPSALGSIASRLSEQFGRNENRETTVSTHLPEATDRDPKETLEWIESLEAVIAHEGPARARYLMKRVLDAARLHRVEPKGPFFTDYVNTISPEEEPEFPGDRDMEKRVRRIIRWNAV